MKQVHGWSFPDADQFMARELQTDGTYQSSHLTEALKYVTDYRVAIDGGAHVGTWSRLLAHAFERVIAVEPSPDTFEALTANMRRFDCANVDALNVALGASPGFVSMALDGRPAQQHNTGGRHVEPGGTIRCEAIDDWNLSVLGFLKLDIEGSEPAALEGAAITLTRCQPVVLFEDKGFCVRFGKRKDAAQVLLTSLGYRHLARISADEVWGPA